MLKAFSDPSAVLLVDKVELALLCRTTCSYQFVEDASPDKFCQRILHLRLFILVQWLYRNIYARNLDARIQHAEQCVLQGIEIVQSWHHSSVAVDLQVLNLVDRDCVFLRVHFYSP